MRPSSVFCLLQKVQITFTSFDLESGYDWVKIYDGQTSCASSLSTLSGRLVLYTIYKVQGSGGTVTDLPNPTTTPVLTTCTTSGTSAFVDFHTDYSITRSGFSASVSFVKDGSSAEHGMCTHGSTDDVSASAWVLGNIS